jgi:hypothetical protein
MNQFLELGLTHSSRPVWLSDVAGFYWQPQVQIVYSGATSTDTIDLSGDTASWVFEAAKKLEALGRFHTGWDSYGGLSLRHGAKHLALQVLGWLRRDELPIPAVVLGSAGNVQLEWRAKGKELEVELRDNGTIEYVKVSPAGEIEEGEAASDLSRKLRDLADWLRHS